jgi:hypothetical protein
MITENKHMEQEMKDCRLVWHDEFDSEGDPDPEKWSYDIGANSWGNDESQYYTNRIQNAYVKGGMLHIMALREDFGGIGAGHKVEFVTHPSDHPLESKSPEILILSGFPGLIGQTVRKPMIALWYN